jgi:carbonic anhydrase
MSLPARLIDGYRAFVAQRLPLERSRYQKLAESGQNPEVMVICCCDSRVSPEVIFDAHPGELFVVRNVANLVPPYSPTGFTHGVSAALEFAVQGLKVRYIVVMGHSHCGGVRAYVEHKGRADPGDFIDNWMALIAPAAKSLGEGINLSRSDYLARLERASIVATMDNLTSFPWIKSGVAQERLKLLGAYFDVGTGALEIYDPVAGVFTPMNAEAAAAE